MNGTMNWKPIYRYALRDYLTGAAIVCAVLVAITVITMAVSGAHGDETVRFNGASMSIMVMMLVYGIVAPRPFLRLSAQFGVSRRTAFLGMNLAALTSTVLFAAVMELLAILASLQKNFFWQEFYQMTYLRGAKSMTAGQHLTSVVLNVVLMAAMFFLGMFFTTLFWRLNRVGIGVAVAVMLLLVNGMPTLVVRTAVCRRAAAAFFRWIAGSVWNLTGAFALMAVIGAVVSWLLIRTVNIKARARK